MTGLADRPAERSQRAVPAVGTAGCSRLGADGIYNCSADEMTVELECDDPCSGEQVVRLARE